MHLSFRFLFLLFAVGISGLRAQDSAFVSQKVKDSIHAYKVSQIDTSFVDFSSKRIQPFWSSGLHQKPMQIHLPQTKGVAFWIVILLLFSLLVLVLIKWRDEGYFEDLFKAFFSLNPSQPEAKEFYHTGVFGSVMLNLVYVILMGRIIQYFVLPAELQTPLFCLYTTIAYGLHYLFRHFIINRLGQITERPDIFDSLWFNVSIINQASVFILLPLLFSQVTGAHHMQAELSYAMLTVLSIGQLYKYFRGILWTLSDILQHFFHFLIYICTLELAPVVIIIYLTRMYLHA